MNDTRDKVEINICCRVDPFGFVEHFISRAYTQSSGLRLRRDREAYAHVLRCRDCFDSVAHVYQTFATGNRAFDTKSFHGGLTYLEDGQKLCRVSGKFIPNQRKS